MKVRLILRVQRKLRFLYRSYYPAYFSEGICVSCTILVLSNKPDRADLVDYK